MGAAPGVIHTGRFFVLIELLYIIKHQYLNGNGSSLCPGGPKPLSPLTLEKVFKKFTKFNDVELSILILTETQQGGH
jgi:hypothetical protein